jgi:hypothetical protein
LRIALLSLVSHARALKQADGGGVIRVHRGDDPFAICESERVAEECYHHFGAKTLPPKVWSDQHAHFADAVFITICQPGMSGVDPGDADGDGPTLTRRSSDLREAFEALRGGVPCQRAANMLSYEGIFIERGKGVEVAFLISAQDQTGRLERGNLHRRAGVN